MSLILIADDNPHAHRMGRQILNQEGHDVETASDGDEAIRFLAERRPDIVMVDTRMPGPNGFEICRHVKSTPALEGVRVVLLAGPLEPFDQAEAESAGADGVLHKPLDAYTLIEKVNSLLDGSSPAATPDKPPPAESRETAAAAAVEVDPLSDLVRQALAAAEPARNVEQAVYDAVREVLEAALPTLADTITRRVVARLEENQ